MLSRILVVLSISMMFSAADAAGIYKWVDEDGKVHYSQTRPPEHEAEKMRVPTRAPENTSTYKRPSLKTDKDDESDDKSDQAGGAKQQADQGLSSEEKAKICARARKVLETLNSRGRVRQKDEQGNIVYMTEEQKQQRTQAEKDKIAKYCK